MTGTRAGGLFAALFLSAAAALAQVGPMAVQSANLESYAQHGAALGFVATAITGLGNCPAPLEFRDVRRGSVQILEITCPAGAETRFARLTFVRVPDGDGAVTLRPFRIEFLP
ncbi:MAG: hypothetical protein ACE5DK_04300 [Paracoccaceae bacterium]